MKSFLGYFSYNSIRDSSLICLLYIFFLHLFILQTIYIVLQDLKMKMLFVELNIRLQE